MENVYKVLKFGKEPNCHCWIVIAFVFCSSISGVVHSLAEDKGYVYVCANFIDNKTDIKLKLIR